MPRSEVDFRFEKTSVYTIETSRPPPPSLRRLCYGLLSAQFSLRGGFAQYSAGDAAPWIVRPETQVLKERCASLFCISSVFKLTFRDSRHTVVARCLAVLGPCREMSLPLPLFLRHVKPAVGPQIAAVLTEGGEAVVTTV